MRVHWLQHVAYETLGSIAPLLAAGGHQTSVTRLHASEALPDVGALDALIVMGGPMNIYEYDAYPWLRAEQAFIKSVLAAGKPVLGICLGAQLLADALGAPVTSNEQQEIGWFEVQLSDAGRASPAFAGLPERFTPFHWHGDRFAIPAGAQALIASEACPHQAFALRTAGGALALGLQFHLEVTAADARSWYAQHTPEPARYVQAAAEVLAQLDRFADNNRLMQTLLANWLGAASSA